MVNGMKDIKLGIIVNLLIIIVCVVLFRSVSYSIDTNTKPNKDLLINTGNMQVILNTENDKYELNNNTINNGYSFSIKNTGNIPIEYYEIRIVDQENKVSTLPHKYINFSINNDEVYNLGDNDSIIYSGYNLDIGKTKNFNLKIWIDDNIDSLGKELYGAIEITLYQKYDVYKNYVLYESDDSTNVVVRTSIYNPITTTIPKKEGYKFVGWKSMDNIIYYPGDAYNKDIGETLYAFWEKA